MLLLLLFVIAIIVIVIILIICIIKVSVNLIYNLKYIILIENLRKYLLFHFKRREEERKRQKDENCWQRSGREFCERERKRAKENLFEGGGNF